MMKLKQVFIFDIDGTIADSYGPIKKDNAQSILKLLQSGKKVVFATDRSKDLIVEKIIKLLPEYNIYLPQIYIIPAGGAALYQYDNAWQEVYAHRIDTSVIKKAIVLHKKILLEVDPDIASKYEQFVLNKDGLMLSLSAMPDISDRKERLEWDIDCNKRKKIIQYLQDVFPEMHINIGGSTTINIACKGINKAYGLRQLFKILPNIMSESVYFGDAMHKGGNDRCVKDELDIETVHVKNPAHTKEVLEMYIDK